MTNFMGLFWIVFGVAAFNVACTSASLSFFCNAFRFHNLLQGGLCTGDWTRNFTMFQCCPRRLRRPELLLCIYDRFPDHNPSTNTSISQTLRLCASNLKIPSHSGSCLLLLLSLQQRCSFTPHGLKYCPCLETQGPMAGVTLGTKVTLVPHSDICSCFGSFWFH